MRILRLDPEDEGPRIPDILVRSVCHSLIEIAFHFGLRQRDRLIPLRIQIQRFLILAEQQVGFRIGVDKRQFEMLRQCLSKLPDCARQKV